MKIVYVITKSKFGLNKNYFLFSPIPNKVRESRCERSEADLGGPTKFLKYITGYKWTDKVLFF